MKGSRGGIPCGRSGRGVSRCRGTGDVGRWAVNKCESDWIQEFEELGLGGDRKHSSQQSRRLRVESGDKKGQTEGKPA